MSLEMRACIECHGLFHRRSGHIRCAVCQLVHENDHYRSTVGKLRKEDRGINEIDAEVKSTAEKMRAASIWSDRMKLSRWNVRRREGEG